ncbi:2-hydroxyacyl-CoA dehydratase [Emcibacter nanhaiensis]|uniref:2-hydroxyacyl-CoA dehydratase n=1 Tax=Emcibacter nanhaiensis TaxID=1505037 RepID=A0A501PS10_9PROT|nr:2-hydroxyacyl-CoA dehydratase [Emcibacter nanhaiensis]TPD62938.1 2-hydroxyacyl-CoA dehydratase [Emcibacter nanhaiensis]
MNVKDSIYIVWNAENAGANSGQEFEPGLYFYGYWKNSLLPELETEKLLNAWHDAKVAFKAQKIKENDYNHIVIDMRVFDFPPQSQWLTNIRKTLQFLSENGAMISWCGDETCHGHLSIFNPTEASGNIYAAYSKENGFYCNSDLDEEIHYLNDEQLAIFGKVLG